MANYKQWDGTTLGSLTACPSCYVTLNLCYGSTADALCCGSATPAVVYVAPGETFASNSGLYSDNTLTTVATSGYYSDDVSC